MSEYEKRSWAESIRRPWVIALLVALAVAVVLAVALGVYFGTHHNSSSSPSPSPPAKYPQLKLAQGLVVNGTTNVTYTQTELIASSNIVVKDYGVLILDTATLTLDLSAGPNTVIVQVLNYGQLILRNVLVQQAGVGCSISNWQFQDNSVVTMQNVQRICNWFTITGQASYSSSGGNTGITLLPGFAGKLSISGEQAVWLELFFRPGTISVSNVPQAGDPLDSSSGFLAQMIAANNWPGAVISVTSCAVQEIDVGVGSGVFVPSQTPSFSPSPGPSGCSPATLATANRSRSAGSTAARSPSRHGPSATPL